MRKICWQSWVTYTVVFCWLFNRAPIAQAGWTGSMNGTGLGWASVNVVSSTTFTNKVSTTTLLNPSSSIPPATGYITNMVLPSGSSTSTVARVKGSAGYVWQASTLGSNGDRTDNSDIENRANIVAADCAALSMNSSSIPSPDGLSGTLVVDAAATPGTGLLLRGFEYFGNVPPTSIDDLVANGLLKFDILLVGPFDLNQSNCTAIVIPYTTQTGASNLFFVTEGEAKSNPLTITCPGTVVVGCADSVVYPPVQTTGGCGGVTVSYSPPASTLPIGINTVTATATDQLNNSVSCTFLVDTTSKAFSLTCSNVVFKCSDPLVYPSPQIKGGCGQVSVSYNPPANLLAAGSTNVITATAVDQIGKIAQCTFIAIRQSDTFNGFYSPINGTGGNCSSPLRTINLGSIIPIKFDDSCNGSPLVTGSPTLTIQLCPSGTVIGGGNFQVVQNVWHFNWDTTGLSKGVYRLVATLQDGSQQFAVVQLK